MKIWDLEEQYTQIVVDRYPGPEPKFWSVKNLMTFIECQLLTRRIPYVQVECSGAIREPTLRRARFPRSDPSRPESTYLCEVFDNTGIYIIGNFLDVVEVGIAYSPKEKMLHRISDKVRDNPWWVQYCCVIACIVIHADKHTLEMIEREIAIDEYELRIGWKPIARGRRA